MMKHRHPAVFLDRDGTLIEDRHYLADPEQVHLLPGVSYALTRLQAAAYRLVVVTNQSGLARGLVKRKQYDAVESRMAMLLEAEGVTLDGTYVCPHHPDLTGPCDCRKPGTALFLQAERELDLDLERSWLIGDRWRDVAPALSLGARGVLLPNDETPAEDRAHHIPGITTVSRWDEVVDVVLSAQ